jgi:hypothetical protein
MKAAIVLVAISFLLANCASSGPNTNSIRTSPTSSFGTVDHDGGPLEATKRTIE